MPRIWILGERERERERERYSRPASLLGRLSNGEKRELSQRERDGSVISKLPY
jgi:hypothetical protein